MRSFNLECLTYIDVHVTQIQVDYIKGKHVTSPRSVKQNKKVSSFQLLKYS